MLDPNLSELSSQSTTPTGPVFSPPPSTASSSSPPSGASSIDQSTAVIVMFVPISSSPQLVPPSDTDGKLLVGIVGAGKEIALSFLRSQALAMSEIISRMLDNWNSNIQKLEELVKQIINSPDYLVKQEIRLKGGESESQVAGLTPGGAVSASVPTTVGEQVTAFSPNERLKTYRNIAPTGELRDTSNPTDDSTKVTIPFMAMVIAGGAITVGTFEMTTSINGMSSTPFSAPMELVNRLQPIVPQLMPELIPMINLLVTPMIYFTSWDTSINSISNKDKANSKEAAQNFAKEVISMISKPDFILVNIVNKMDGAEQMSTERKDQQVAIIKLILASVALCLLYSVEVGKVMDGKFWGMEPQEFQGMLNGNIPIPSPQDQKLSKAEQMKYTLLMQVKSQLDVLPADQKVKIIESLFAYMTHSRNIDDMLNPTKVFTEVLSSSQFDAATPNLEASKT